MRVLDATAGAHETPTPDLTNAAVAPAATNPIPVPDTAAGAAAERAAAAKKAESGQVAIYQNPNSTRVAPAPVRASSNTTGQTGKPSAAGQNNAPGTPSVQPPPVEAKTTAAKPERTADLGAAGSPPQTATAQPPHPVVARTDTQRQTPAPNASGSPPPNTGSTINGWDSSAPERPRSTAAPPASTPAPALESKAPVFVPPKPLLQVMPNTRSLAPGVISQVTRVEIAVRIDNAGHVLSAHVLNDRGSTNGALSGAAAAAARQWTFQPATLQGEKVESEHTIVFEFRPENQQ
jgi:TonB family protein